MVEVTGSFPIGRARRSRRPAEFNAIRDADMGFKQTVKKLVRGPINKLGYDIVRAPRGMEVNKRWLAHFLYLKGLFDLIADVEGDMVECGVGHGHSFFKLCCLACFENKHRMVYGFDSFEGFPEPSAEDDSPRDPKKGEWKVSSVEKIERLLVDRGRIESSFVENNVRLVRGFFDESLTKYDGRSVALLHLDVDLYESYKVTLEHFWPMVAKGGVALFDEYKNLEGVFPGASKAIDEFFGDLLPHMQYSKLANRYYIVKQ